MTNEKLKKYLNDILWWIPFRKLRYIIRELVDTILGIREQNDFILNYLGTRIDGIEYIVLSIAGGFSDQLITYRLGYSIEQLYNRKVLYDISWYSNYGKDDNGKYNRNFELLNIFSDIPFTIATGNEIKIAKIHSNIINRYDDIDILEIIKKYEIFYLNRYYTETSKIKKLDFNEVFDLDKYILQKLDNDNKRVYENIKNCKYSVACHVRRNDRLIHRGVILSNLDEDYFIKAIEKINKKVKGKLKIYFFSDDMDWVKNNLIPLVKDKYEYMAVDINDNDKGYFDFYLISNCKYQIASEGSFCQIAYNFNKYKNKIIIIPDNVKLYE